MSTIDYCDNYATKPNHKTCQAAQARSYNNISKLLLAADQWRSYVPNRFSSGKYDEPRGSYVL